MDLDYPAPVSAALERIGQALADVTLEHELAGQLSGARAEPAATSSPLGHVAEFRALGLFALPLPQLLARTGLSYVQLAPGASALASPDPRAPWPPEDSGSVKVNQSGECSGCLRVAPFCLPADRVLFLASGRLVECPMEMCHPTFEGDAAVLTLNQTPVRVLAEGKQATASWQQATNEEGLGLLGLTLGLIDRAWRIALDALCEGKRGGDELASEQVAQFQLADNDIERMAAERLVLDVAIDAEHGRPFDGKLAMVRYSTSSTAERCAARALHLASLFLPRIVPIARLLTERAHHLSLFGLAREHEVRLASAALADGLSLE